MISNNIGVNPKVVCYTEHSEPTVDARRGQSQVSLFCAFLRSFTFVQDDKFTQKMKHGPTAILLLYDFQRQTAVFHEAVILSEAKNPIKAI